MPNLLETNYGVFKTSDDLKRWVKEKRKRFDETTHVEFMTIIQESEKADFISVKSNELSPGIIKYQLTFKDANDVWGLKFNLNGEEFVWGSSLF